MRFSIQPGEELELDIDQDIRLSDMRHIRQWFPHLSGITSLIAGFKDGDPDAIASFVWVARRKLAKANNGPAPVEPNRMEEDFALGQFFISVAERSPELTQPVDPPTAAVPIPTQDSTQTPANSDLDT